MVNEPGGTQRAPAAERPATRRRARLHEVIFEPDTRAGRYFDLALIWLMVLSVASGKRPRSHRGKVVNSRQARLTKWSENGSS